MRGLALALLVPLCLAGCQAGPGGPPAAGGGAGVPEAPRSFNGTLDLEVGPPADDVVPGIVFGYDECGFVRPQAEGEAIHIHAGRAVLAWDDSDGLRMNLSLRAERGAATARTPDSPSPLNMTFGAIDVGWDSAMLLAAGAMLPPGELMRPATLRLEFTYDGDEPAVHSTNC